jgi:hypothetical protein
MESCTFSYLPVSFPGGFYKRFLIAAPNFPEFRPKVRAFFSINTTNLKMVQGKNEALARPVRNAGGADWELLPSHMCMHNSENVKRDWWGQPFLYCFSHSAIVSSKFHGREHHFKQARCSRTPHF